MGARGREFLGRRLLTSVVLVVTLGAFSSSVLAAPASPEEGGPTADCRGDAGDGSLEVRCQVSGILGGAEIVLRARALEDDDTRVWVGSGTVEDDGRGEVAVAVPCVDVPRVRAEVLVPTTDDGRFRHVQDLAIPEQCDDGTRLLWAVVLTGAFLLGVLGLVVWWWRRERRRRRVTRAGRGRPGVRRPRGGGRRRSRGRRSRRR